MRMFRTISAVMLGCCVCISSVTCADAAEETVEVPAQQLQVPASDQKSSPDLNLQKTEKELPVILLTGFEPFGSGRPPNPSWEGVKPLNGEEWKGYRIVARQLPVVWGAPLVHLEKWVDELHPVAIFSFGQGGGYALETLGENRRGRGLDNNGSPPKSNHIVEDGERAFTATIEFNGIAGELAKKGYRIRISNEAGNYLCEECLYSLEYLKSTKKLEATVLFCHVPPLSNRYSTADAEKFMREMLESWYTVYRKAAADKPVQK